MSFELGTLTQNLTLGSADSPEANTQHSSLAIHLILLIGLPGSGKSSLAAALLRDCPHRRLISTDTIRSHLFGDEAIQGSWLKVWRVVNNQFRQTAQQISERRVSEAIYDATNAVRRDRCRAIALARACGFTTITGIWVNTPLELCLQRNQQRDRRVPDTVILHMHRCLTAAPPATEDGCDRLIELSSSTAIAPTRFLRAERTLMSAFDRLGYRFKQAGRSHLL